MLGKPLILGDLEGKGNSMKDIEKKCPGSRRTKIDVQKPNKENVFRRRVWSDGQMLLVGQER